MTTDKKFYTAVAMIQANSLENTCSSKYDDPDYWLTLPSRPPDS